MRRYQHRSKPTSFPLPPSSALPDQKPKGSSARSPRPFAATTMWAMTSRDGQQLVEIAVAQPATIRTTGDLAAAVRAGCVPVALSPPVCRDGPWSAGAWDHDHADAAWHGDAAGRC